MDCKGVKKYFDTPSEIIDTEVLKHLETCDACKVSFLEFIEIEDDISKLFEEMPYDTSLDRQLLKKLKIRKPKIVIIAASMMIGILLMMNPNFMAMASKFPLIQSIIELFERDEEVQFGVDQGLPVFDFVSEANGLQLIVKDLYIDTSSIMMQFSTVYESGIVPSEVKITVDIPDLINYPITFLTTSDTTWISINENIVLRDFTQWKVDVLFKVELGDEIVMEEVVEIETSHLLGNKRQVYDISQYIEWDDQRVFIKEIEVGLVEFVLVYEGREDINNDIDYFVFSITDDQGRVYKSNGASGSSNNIYTKAKFERKAVDQSSETLIITLKSNPYVNYEVFELNHNEGILEYRGNTFKIVKSKENSKDKFVVTSEKELSASMFPILYYQTDDSWNPLESEDPVMSAVNITYKEFEDFYGQDIVPTTDMDLKTFADDYAEKNGLHLDVIDLAYNLQAFEEQDYIYVMIKDQYTQKIFINKYVHQYKGKYAYRAAEINEIINKSIEVNLSQ